MVKIRLQRVGAKKQPSYRIVAIDARKPRSGAAADIIGHYNPRTDPPTIVINEEKALKWLKNGAQPSESAAILLQKQGILAKTKQQISSTA